MTYLCDRCDRELTVGIVGAVIDGGYLCRSCVPVRGGVVDKPGVVLPTVDVGYQGDPGNPYIDQEALDGMEVNEVRTYAGANPDSPGSPRRDDLGERSW